MDENFFNTIKYYNDNAKTFVSHTVNADLCELYDKFLSMLPSRARILDAGSGSGRDTKSFREMGHEVVAIDASIEMVKATSNLSQGPNFHATFCEYQSDIPFDGIWACASLLHVSSREMTKTLQHLSDMLKIDGCMFVSFKIGRSQQIRNGRFFHDMDEMSWHSN